MEKFIPLNNYVLFKEVEQKKSKYEHNTVNYADKVPRGKVVEVDSNTQDLEKDDEFLYRIFQEVPKVYVGDETFSLVKFEQIYGKFTLKK